MESNLGDKNYLGLETNNFKEYKEFKAEEYFIKENSNSSDEIFKSSEFSDNNVEVEKQNASKFEQINKIQKLSSNITRIFTTTISSLSVIVGVSIALPNIIPSLNIFDNNKVFVKDNSLIDKSIANLITIEGEIKNYNTSFEYYSYVSQYKDDEIISEKQKSDLIFSDNLFTFNVDAYYGISSYQYDIYYKQDNIENLLYKSPIINFNIKQEYNAKYTKVKPNESKITFNNDGTYNVNIQTGFETDYIDIYSYGLNIINEEGLIIANYEGTESNLNITTEPLREMYFEYYDIGKFAQGNHIYNKERLTNNSLINLPILYFNEETLFNEEYFIIPYSIETIYDINNFSLDLTIENNNKSVKKHYDEISYNDQIILDDFNGELEHLTINGELTFKDTLLDNYVHKIQLEEQSYSLKYNFNIDQITANIVNSGNDYIDVNINCSYQIPKSYKINIKDNHEYNETFSLNNEYKISSLPSGDGGTLTLTILDNNDNVYKTYDYEIFTKETITNVIVSPTNYTYVNPGDSVVTYNDDNTLNIYRDLNFEAANENNYYDSFIYNSKNYDTNEYYDYYHHISNQRYSIMEDLAFNNYYFEYYLLYKYNNVLYYYDYEMPSGGIEVINNSLLNATGIYNQETNKTEIIIKSSKSGGGFDTYCIIDNTNYNFDSSGDEYLTLTLDGNYLNKEITIFYSITAQNYEISKNTIPMKGNKYKNYNLIIQGE